MDINFQKVGYRPIILEISRFNCEKTKGITIRYNISNVRPIFDSKPLQLLKILTCAIENCKKYLLNYFSKIVSYVKNTFRYFKISIIVDSWNIFTIFLSVAGNLPLLSELIAITWTARPMETIMYK